MNAIAISTAVPTRRWFPWVAASAVALVVVAGYWLVVRGRSGPDTYTGGGKFVMVTPSAMDVKVKKDGEIQAINNIDIVNLCEGSSTIVEIVREGSMVKKGDVLVVLDSSETRQEVEDATLALQKAESDLKSAKEMQRIQENQNSADLEAAQVELDLARLALREYSEGTYPEALANAETALKMAEITVKNKEEELEQTKTLFVKGFVTAAQVKADELGVTTVRNDMRKAETALKVLTEFTYPTELATKKSALSQADQKLGRVKITGASELEQKVVAVQAGEAALSIAKRKLEHRQEQLAHSTIKAPADGMVVYAPADRNEGRAMAEGAIVRERQQLLRLPDTSSMKVVVRANESQVTKLQVGQQATVQLYGVPGALRATLTKKSPIADSGSRFWNPDLKEYPIELTLNETPPNILPGMGAQAEIFVQRLWDVLTVPLSAIYSERTTNYVFVKRDGKVVPQPVQIGQTNETHAQVASGLTGGQEVLILQAGQGRELLEKAGIRPEPEQREEEGQAPADADKPGPAAAVAPEAAAAPDAARGAPPRRATPRNPGRPRRLARPRPQRDPRRAREPGGRRERARPRRSGRRRPRPVLIAAPGSIYHAADPPIMRRDRWAPVTI